MTAFDTSDSLKLLHDMTTASTWCLSQVLTLWYSIPSTSKLELQVYHLVLWYFFLLNIDLFLSMMMMPINIL